MNQILKLEVTDDITSIRSRIDFASPHLTRQALQEIGRPEPIKLLLVVPYKNEALHSLVNVKLLARWVRTRSIEIAIVSAHPIIRDYAKASGLKTFGSLRTAKWAGWITSQTPIVSPQEIDPPIIPFGQGVTTANDRTSNDRKKRRRKKRYEVVAGDRPSGALQQTLRQIGILLLLIIFALAFVFGVIALLPQATVTLTPIAQSVEAELTVKADPEATSVDFRELTFPARIDQVELKIFGEIETQKTELAPVGKSSGRVVFINRTEQEQTIPISTTLSTSAGEPIEFTTVETATIPAGIGSTSTSILVVASEPGPRGNVQVAQINRFVDGFYALRARVVNEESMTGGTLEPARVVEVADKERLDAYLRQRIQQEGLIQLQEQLGEQEFIPPESVQVITLDIKYQEFSGDFSNSFGGEMQAVVRATVIGGYNANRLALAALEAQVPPDHTLDLEGLRFGAGEVLNIQDKVVTFKIFAEGKTLPQIDNHQVAQEIAWLPIGDAQDFLSQEYQLATVPGVDLQPGWLVDWLGRLPFSAIRINVIINDAVILVADRE